MLTLNTNKSIRKTCDICQNKSVNSKTHQTIILDYLHQEFEIILNI